MEIVKLDIPDCIILKPQIFEDNRGNFYESYNKKALEELGLCYNFVQDNESYTRTKGTIRGLHFQIKEASQTKLIHCSKGAILGIVIDMRKNSITYKKQISYELSEENHYQILVPRGCAWGFQTLKDNTVVNYKLDNYYNASLERGLLYNDPTFNINWPIKDITISDKDKKQPLCDNIIDDILITGITGQLGHDVYRTLKDKYPNINIYAPTQEELDITDSSNVKKYIDNTKPDVIIHCAAYTNVEKSEEYQADCYNVNVNGTKNIVKASLKYQSKIIFISSDYVYDGTKKDIYTEEDLPNPINYYGTCKVLGEDAIKENNKHFILRTSWLFGINGNNFLKSMIKLSETKKELDIVDDQIGSPTYTLDLANLISEMIFKNNYGTYHVTNNGFCSWNELTKYLLKKLDINTKVNNISTSDYKNKTFQKANRPLNSKLSKNKLKKEGYELLPDWQNAVDRFLDELK